MDSGVECFAPQILGGRCFLGIYPLGPSGAYASMMMSRRRAALTPKAWSTIPRSNGRMNHRRLFVTANQSQEIA